MLPARSRGLQLWVLGDRELHVPLSAAHGAATGIFLGQS